MRPAHSRLHDLLSFGCRYSRSLVRDHEQRTARHDIRVHRHLDDRALVSELDRIDDELVQNGTKLGRNRLGSDVGTYVGDDALPAMISEGPQTRESLCYNLAHVDDRTVVARRRYLRLSDDFIHLIGENSELVTQSRDDPFPRLGSVLTASYHLELLESKSQHTERSTQVVRHLLYEKPLAISLTGRGEPRLLRPFESAPESRFEHRDLARGFSRNRRRSIADRSLKGGVGQQLDRCRDPTSDYPSEHSRERDCQETESQHRFQVPGVGKPGAHGFHQRHSPEDPTIVLDGGPCDNHRLTFGRAELRTGIARQSRLTRRGDRR